MTAPNTSATANALVPLALADLDPEDTTWCLRAALAVDDLAASLATSGQQTPIAVRHLGDGRLQLVSGFRRVAAARALGWPTLMAVVREDLDADADAFRAAVAENVGRRSYTDLDRALVAHRAITAGHTVEEAGALLGLRARQVRNLTALLRLPPEARAALADPSCGFTTAHALTLRAHELRLAPSGAADPDAPAPASDAPVAPRAALDWPTWVAAVTDTPLSVAQLKRRLAAAPAASSPAPRLLLQLRAQRATLSALSPIDRWAVREELEHLLDLLDDLPTS